MTEMRDAAEGDWRLIIFGVLWDFGGAGIPKQGSRMSLNFFFSPLVRMGMEWLWD